ncbi:tRNA (N(6)-L-threonylcarbamoyladenosine(37)-C(2))-methylthiotransferase MtaB [Labilibaculum euxinus]|uniref:tRNA (N(6)-L-threonylcarbamoyladenosine(37)-C(2))-methylthiotransferase MtaB n=1 Tax=Labilibaculum euxinus TaxID=2686357 RepID=A0A7M4D0U8_9BACT|nr:tRNA (N(6)-L-threonylcarbamoyladenosine(37)-C(2))-methylthiotransferase MtaB [Labilibaculum euxinus]MUP36277.1 tRNA (N(6)-L-threonylcarbamoyladenosine(37)-C(2))-methylthiotransferase MtaB [Labilibaculum euxinus]MVB05482.1 tRNA (N(6)-L-threonylcarbamoyladenosine(37)-C(2))-methylthiotransferase MtaB [Labilibaculum euxinus]
MLQGKKVAFYTLGCKLNFSETSTIGRSFKEMGFETIKHTEKADIYIINTCSVTDHADKKCRQAIKKVIKTNANAFIVVIGCYAQLKPDEIIAIPGVDLVLGANEKFNIHKYIDHLEKKGTGELHPCEVESVKDFHSSYSMGDRTRCFLKIQDGCNYYCTYCTIPFARGNSRNMSISETVQQAEKVAKQGAKEIILTGVNIGDFGKSTNETFLDLIKELEKVKGISRFRISSIEPNLLSNEIIEFVAQSEKFVNHFHLPLQAGSNKVLKLMKRRYNRELFAQRIEKIKSLLPDAFIGVDVIAGSRGESDQDFEDAYLFIKELPISQLHVFPYSERQGTKALEIKEVVPIPERKRRAKILQILSEKKLNAFYRENLGKTEEVLFESFNDHGKMYGFTKNYIKIEIPYNQNLSNKLTFATLQEINSNGNVSGSVVDKIRFNLKPVSQ